MYHSLTNELLLQQSLGMKNAIPHFAYLEGLAVKDLVDS